MPHVSDATPAYRGYRLQALYTLWRILDSHQSGLIFQPEGLEDLTIYTNASHIPHEIIQIKAYSTPLTLSDFDPRSSNSFFQRAIHYIQNDPQSTVKLISFGEVGQELAEAFEGVPSSRSRTIDKLIGYGFSDQEAADILDVIVLDLVDEQEGERYQVSHDRLETILSGNEITVHYVAVEQRGYGEFLFVTLCRQGRYVTFYGLGEHNHRQRWYVRTWFWYSPQSVPTTDAQSLSKAEVMTIIEQRKRAIAKQVREFYASREAALSTLLAAFNDPSTANGQQSEILNLVDDLACDG